MERSDIAGRLALHFCEGFQAEVEVILRRLLLHGALHFLRDTATVAGLSA